MLAWLRRLRAGLLLGGLALATLLTVFYRGRAAGKAQARQAHDEQVNKQAAQARQEARNVQLETARMDDAAIADELKRDWVRGAGPGRR